MQITWVPLTNAMTKADVHQVWSQPLTTFFNELIGITSTATEELLTPPVKSDNSINQDSFFIFSSIEIFLIGQEI